MRGFVGVRMGRYVWCALPNTMMVESLDCEGANVMMEPILYEMKKVSNNGYEGSHARKTFKDVRWNANKED